MFMYQFIKGEPVQRMKPTLPSLAFAWANRWTIWVQSQNGEVHMGLIVGIKMESGYHLNGSKPEHFIVSIVKDDRVTEVYMRLEAA